MHAIKTAMWHIRETRNALEKIVKDVQQTDRPLLIMEYDSLKYADEYMKEIRDGWLYYMNDGVLILVKPKENCKQRLFCINTYMFDANFLSGIQNQELYGENRRHPLRNVISVVKNEILNQSFDYRSILWRVRDFKCKHSNVAFVCECNQNFIYSAHIMHNGEKCTCCVVASGKSNLYCSYICLPDSIVNDVINIAKGRVA